MKKRYLYLLAAGALPAFSVSGAEIDHKTDLGFGEGNSVISGSPGISADGTVVVSSYSDFDFGGNKAAVVTVGDKQITALGDHGAMTYSTGVSADGSAVTGITDGTASHDYQAFFWRKGDSRITVLGSLRADNTGDSFVWGISADGTTVVGEARADDSVRKAFIWREGDSQMTSLGTLRAGNSGYSAAVAVSADGSVVVGQANTESSYSHAFIWHRGSGMTDLGTLRTDNSGGSLATAVSADGSAVTGSAESDTGSYNAFFWREGDSKMTSLGTLSADNSGSSHAKAMSADGSAVVGFAENDDPSFRRHAFFWREGDSKMTGLGTLRADNSGDSIAVAVSADGSAVVGTADNDTGNSNAFFWYESDSQMVNLGTLAADNSGDSSATGISADGTVVAGVSGTDDGENHVTVWKINYPAEPGDLAPPEVTVVDATNSGTAMTDTGRRGFKVLDLYQSSLSSLSNSRCQSGQSDYCIGVFSQFDSVNRNHRPATGLFGSFRLPEDSWIVGGAINFANNTRLTDNYDTRGSNQPGVGFFTRYQQNRNNDGLSIELSGAFLRQDISITRDTLQNTEAGEGDTRIRGYQAGLSAEYGIALSERTRISPRAALTYRDISRDGYTETRNAEFAATYGRLGNKRTDLQLGINGQHSLTETVQIDGSAGMNIKLDSQRDAFTGKIPYIGAYAYDTGAERDVSPYIQAGVDINVTKNSVVRINAGWQQTDYRNDAARAGVSYSRHW